MRISTTTLESYRLWRDPEQEWMADDDLLATIRGEFTGTHKVWLGLAFGAVLETPERFRVSGGYRVESLRGCSESFAFSDAVMWPALALIDRDRTVFEAKGLGSFAGHDVVAKADQMVGSALVETKTTLSSFDFDKYAQSCQWRFMADIFNVPRVTYHVFCLSEDPAGVIELRGVETFHLYRYASMRDDCEALVRDFAGFVDAKGLREHLDARQAALVGAL